MPQPISDGTRPNILIFITDQFHPDCLGYAGHPMVRTPNLDRLAAGGMNFSRMYTSQPLCIPARNHVYRFNSAPAYRKVHDELRLRLLDTIIQTNISTPRQLCRA